MKYILFLLLLVTAEKSFAQKMRINHIAINVTNMKQSIEFYHDVLNLDTIPEPFHDGKHAWFRIGEGISFHVIQDATERKPQSKLNHICFSTPSMKEFIDRLTKKGIGYEDLAGKPQTIQQRVDGVQQIYLKDPDGYWIEVNDAK